ncbi:PepSY domain-containing protein [Spirillospora sp. NPDC029432]|uniref:PepSY domain-containing protein n=1 Tax=Spirillospora sp. NPDC029432 TaxID=3154599 RepID=UPI0034561114
MKKILVTVAAAGVLAAGGAATAFAAEDDGDGARGERRVTDVKVTAEQAAAAALKAVPGGRIESIELDDDAAGKRAWDVDILSGNTFRDEVVDANTGTVTTNEKDDDRNEGDDRDDARRLNAAKIDAVQAARTALQTAKGTVTSVDLDDDGKSWEVELTGADGTERELRIDTATGKVTANAADDDQNDDQDGDDRNDGAGDGDDDEGDDD